MIAKITHGRSAARALAYDHGPGRADEHHNPRKVAGNVAGRDWRIRAHHMQRFVNAHQNDKGDRGVYRIALANPESDRVLSDREWRAIAERFVERFGADKGMWEATRHDRHHIHLTISKDRFDGGRMSTSHDYRRVAAICRELEREHALTNAAERGGRGSARTRGDREQAQRGAGQPDRDWLRATISRVLGDGGGIEELRAAGVQLKLNQASTGRIAGISYARAPEPDVTAATQTPSGSKAANWARPTAGTKSATNCATPPLSAASRPSPNPQSARHRPPPHNVVIPVASCPNHRPWNGRWSLRPPVWTNGAPRRWRPPASAPPNAPDNSSASVSRTGNAKPTRRVVSVPACTITHGHHGQSPTCPTQRLNCDRARCRGIGGSTVIRPVHASALLRR